uniref:Uncharacterized protein n=1 Tax=Anguilla anguilla TaxID=7936 RepID=A0A0E9SW78_ANGAN
MMQVSESLLTALVTRLATQNKGQRKCSSI